jgi:large subunit ribosomal protein L22
MEAAVGARAVARFVRITPRKARRVVDLIRGLPAERAVDLLRFAPQAAAEPVRKVLESAMANAENNHQLGRDTLRVARAYVDEGSTYKRWRARAQGRPGPLQKRNCHITVIVESVEAPEQATRGPATGKKATAKKSTAKKSTSGESAETEPTAKKASTKKASAKKAGAKKSTAKKAASAEKAATPADKADDKTIARAR